MKLKLDNGKMLPEGLTLFEKRKRCLQCGELNLWGSKSCKGCKMLFLREASETELAVVREHFNKVIHDEIKDRTSRC